MSMHLAPGQMMLPILVTRTHALPPCVLLIVCQINDGLIVIVLGRYLLYHRTVTIYTKFSLCRVFDIFDVS